jgi:hypothetical protein
MGTFPPIHFVMEPDAVSKTVFGETKRLVNVLFFPQYHHNGYSSVEECCRSKTVSKTINSSQPMHATIRELSLSLSLSLSHTLTLTHPPTHPVCLCVYNHRYLVYLHNMIRTRKVQQYLRFHLFKKSINQNFADHSSM